MAALRTRSIWLAYTLKTRRVSIFNIKFSHFFESHLDIRGVGSSCVCVVLASDVRHDARLFVSRGLVFTHTSFHHFKKFFHLLTEVQDVIRISLPAIQAQVPQPTECVVVPVAAVFYPVLEPAVSFIIQSTTSCPIVIY